MTKFNFSGTHINLRIIIFVVISMNLYQWIKISEFQETWNRFTYEDWIALYNSCDLRTWPKTKMIIDTYWDKQTDFKNFLLLKYEDNR